MKKTGILNVTSLKTNGVKFENKWFNVDPLMDLSVLNFGQRYEATFILVDGRWVISQLREVVGKAEEKKG